MTLSAVLRSYHRARELPILPVTSGTDWKSRPIAERSATMGNALFARDPLHNNMRRFCGFAKALGSAGTGSHIERSSLE
jgi:hypothetical protein